MTKLVLVTAYKFEELSEKAKDRIREWYNQDWHFDKWDRQFRTEELEKLGYDDVEMQYSGFYSQGDGASITCAVDLVKFILRNKLGNKFASLLYRLDRHPRRNMIDAKYVQITRESWGNYVHEKLLRANADDLIRELESEEDEEERDENLIAAIRQAEEIVPLVLAEVREKSVELYEWLQADYEWHMSDECLIDVCAANEYLFDVYGEPIHNLIVQPAEAV